MDINYKGFPPQRLSYKSKTESWRKACVDFGANNATINYNPVRNSVIHKKINYDLLNGKLNMTDLQLVINPEGLDAGFIADRIQHYPIMNSKLNVLRGEESKRVFDFRVVVTNPNSISEIERNKKDAIFQSLQQLISDKAISEDDYNQKLEELNNYYSYEWQDLKEIRGNAVLKHYITEYNIPLLFNEGFMDAMAVSEEIYQCDIINGEASIERVDPTKIRVLRSGYSNKIEDADIVVIEDYWSPGKIIDVYHEYLTANDIKKIQEMADRTSQKHDEMDNIDERPGLRSVSIYGDPTSVDLETLFDPYDTEALLPYDIAGNIRVVKVYWKSYRKIKKVKSYDLETGQPIYTLYDETYKIKEELGEEEKILWVNQAWEGTKIGEDIYINMKPRDIQYNRMNNPSKCHFGIIGSIYNLNGNKPFSMVDIMKRYNYYYDAVHDRLNKLMAKNWGKLVPIDLAKVPAKWDIDKWLYYAKTMGLVVTDSFKEGNIGAATGKIAGALNNNTSVIDAEFGNSIQSQINLLEYIKNEMSEVAGISKQREGQISNRETVGGVERATLQSSHITEWLFIEHEDVKRRALECLLETAKVAMKGKSKKFQYILSDITHKMSTIDIDGDEFYESDYGICVDNSNATQRLNQNIDALAQAALQNQALSFSSIMKLYSSASPAEKQRTIEREEQANIQRQQESQQQQMQMQQQQIEAQLQQKQMDLEHSNMLNQRDNDTKIFIAQLQAASKEESSQPQDTYSQESRDKLNEQIREFNEKLALDKERLNFDKDKAKTDAELKLKQINKSNSINK